MPVCRGGTGGNHPAARLGSRGVECFVAVAPLEKELCI